MRVWLASDAQSYSQHARMDEPSWRGGKWHAIAVDDQDIQNVSLPICTLSMNHSMPAPRANDRGTIRNQSFRVNGFIRTILSWAAGKPQRSAARLQWSCDFQIAKLWFTRVASCSGFFFICNLLSSSQKGMHERRGFARDVALARRS